MLNGKDEETEIAVECSVLDVCLFIRCWTFIYQTNLIDVTPTVGKKRQYPSIRAIYTSLTSINKICCSIPILSGGSSFAYISFSQLYHTERID